MMNVVNSGDRYQIYGESLKTYTQLPVGSYEVEFNKMTGFYLISRPDLVTNETKIYGNHNERVDKVLRSYTQSDRNFGIILSGQKGIGKSLFARCLAQKSIENGHAVIVVRDYIPGIANFLGDIEQEVVVIFDEFEKIYGKKDDEDPQEEMLSLFDGMDGGKKLFVITCNEINKLNSYLINRPGRFHYHFILTSPDNSEVREYMTDKLLPQYHNQIDRIVNFATMINMTYDYLRAIAFELNQGYSLEETMNDLNITRNSDIQFDITVYTSGGTVYTVYSHSLDLYSNNGKHIRLYGRSGKSVIINIVPSDIVVKDGQLTLDLDKIAIERGDSDDDWELSEEEIKAREEAFKKSHKITKIEIVKCVYGKMTRYVDV